MAATSRHITALKDFPSARTALLTRDWPSAAEKDMLRKVSLRVSTADNMYVPREARHYLAAGLSGLRCITRVLDHLRTDRASIRSVLDLPSGGGRILRFLQIAFPDASLVACDTDRALLEFCGKVFGARTVPSVPDFNQVRLPATFDLIWCGSLFTHIDETRCTDLLRLFYNHLSHEGVCIFSTAGTTAVSWLRNRAFSFGLSALAQQSLMSQVTDVGFGYGYVNYDRQNYGISFVEHDKMVELAGRAGKWSLAAFLESGWDDFQDVYAFTKRNVAPLNIPQRPFHHPTGWWKK